MMYTTQINSNRSEQTGLKGKGDRFTEEITAKVHAKSTVVEWNYSDNESSRSFQKRKSNKSKIQMGNDQTEEETTICKMSLEPYLEPVKLEDVRLVRGPDDPSKSSTSTQAQGPQNDIHQPSTSIHDGMLPNAERKDSGLPDAERKDSGLPDAERKDSGLPDAERKDSGLPDAERKDSGLPDAERKDSGLPDAERKDSGLPDAERKDSGLPDAERKDSGLPDAERKDSVLPDADRKDSGLPDAERKDSVLSDADRKESGLPDAERKESGYSGYSTAYFNRDFSWVYRVGLLILGYLKAGKSSLMDNLIGIPFKYTKATPSKNDLSTVTVTTDSGWKPLEKPLYEVLIDESEQSQSTGTSTDTHAKDLAINMSCLRGELCYMHQMLLAPSMIYLLVMDVTKEFDAVLPEIQAKEDESGITEQYRTPRDFLDYYLNTISTFLDNILDQSSASKSIIIVLTHPDELDPQTRDTHVDEYKRKVLEHVRKQHHRKNVEKTVIALSSKERNADEVKSLKDLIITLFENYYATKKEFGIPMHIWLQCEADMQNRCTESVRKYLSYGDMEDEITWPIRMSSEQLKQFLKFHSSYGGIMYSDLGSRESIIITDPQFMLDAMQTIINMKRSRNMSHLTLDQENKLEKELEKGIVSGDTLSILWDNLGVINKDKLATTMVNCNQFIQCDPETRNQNFKLKRFIIPALLSPNHSSDDNVKPFRKQPGTKTMVFLFHFSSVDDEIVTSVYLPSSVFFTLVKSLMKKRQNEKPWQVRKLHSNAVQLRAGPNRELLLNLSTRGCMIMLDGYSLVENKHRGSTKCAFANARQKIEKNIEAILQTFRNLHCSVCISPCDITTVAKEHQYSCLEVLGPIGSVGDEPLSHAVCDDHENYSENEHYSCWYCDRLGDEDVYRVDYGKVIRQVTDKILDEPTLMHLAEELNMDRNEVVRACNDHRKIKDATHSVLHSWLNRTGGNLHQLRNALETVGFKDILPQ